MNRKLYQAKKNNSSTLPWIGVDKSLMIAVLALTATGVLLVYNASLVDAHRKFGDPWHFARHQLMWLGIGFGAMVAAMWLPIDWWRRNSKLLLWITIGLLAVVLLGERTLGARRWLSLAGFSLQPSELAKITLSAYLASLAASGLGKSKDYIRASLLVLGLVIAQPDMDTTMVLAASAVVIYWLSGAPSRHIGYLFAGGLVAGIGMILVSPYRLNRLMTFLDVSSDRQGISYHAWQVLIALGSGGLLGVGLGQSRQKYGFLPEVAADSIFAIIAEELGFVGVCVLMGALAFVVLRCLRAARRASDPFAQMFAAGLTTWMGVQMLINMSSMVMLIPLTGITLPFISYGGTSLLVSMTTIGIILQISKNQQSGVASKKWQRRVK